MCWPHQPPGHCAFSEYVDKLTDQRHVLTGGVSAASDVRLMEQKDYPYQTQASVPLRFMSIFFCFNHTQWYCTGLWVLTKCTWPATQYCAWTHPVYSHTEHWGCCSANMLHTPWLLSRHSVENHSCEQRVVSSSPGCRNWAENWIIHALLSSNSYLNCPWARYLTFSYSHGSCVEAKKQNDSGTDESDQHWGQKLKLNCCLLIQCH